MTVAYRKTRRLLTLGFAFAIIALAFVGLVAVRSAMSFVRTAEQTDHHQNILKILSDVRRGLARAEAEQRGFLLTGKEAYLANFDETPKTVYSSFERLDKSGISEESRRDLQNAKQFAIKKINEMTDSVAKYRRGETREALMLIQTDLGLRSMAGFRAAIAKIENREKAALEHAATANRENYRNVIWTIGLGLCSTVVAVLVSMYFVMRDSKRRMEAEEMLHNNLALQRLIFDTVDATIIASDSEGIATHMNRGAEKMTGYSAEEVIGAHWIFQVLHDPEERAAFARKLSQQEGKEISPEYAFGYLPRAGKPFNGEWTYIRKDGHRFPVHLSVNAMRDDEGAVLGMVGIATDLTKERERDAERERYLAELAEKNAQLEISSQELKESRDVALAATRTKSEFLANMSHEIRTPMNGVMGMAHLLQNSTLNERQRGFVRAILQSAESLLTILNDILDVSKMEAGKMTLEHFPFDLRVALEDIAETVAPVAHGKNLELNLVMSPDVPENVIGDPGRLRQVITNLVTNAVKFTSEGEVTISATVVRDHPTRVKYRFSVRDTGLGIPRERQEKIFESFTQADGSTTRRFGGTGLGLTISRQLVELMGGEIGVISELGRGSEFWVEVSLQRQETPIAERPERHSLTGRRVLVADDNATNRTILRELLGSWNCQVDEAENGEQAIEMARLRSYDCAILDMHMPGFDGLDTARKMRRAAQTASLPLVLLSSSGFNPEDVEAASLFAAVLFKPVRSSPLYNAIVHVMGVMPSSQVEDAVPKVAANDELRLRGRRVLVVEDNAVNQMVATELLTTWGCVPVTADNGAAAVAILATDTFDVVLMDVQMPVMDGFEATAEIRREESGTGRHIPIVAMTANAMSGDRERCLRAGMDSYLAKPLRPKALLERLLEILGERGENEVISDGGENVDPEVFEAARLDETCAGKASLKIRVIERYIATSRTSADEIAAATEAGDATRLASAAHALKGSSLTVGSPLVSGLCAAVEIAAREGRVDADTAAKVEPALARLHEALDAYAKELRQSAP